VSETSERLLNPTASIENARWKSQIEISTPHKPKLIDPRTHVLVPTAALKNSEYKKPSNEEDPREKGWNNISTKINESAFNSPVKDATATVSPVKVKEASPHLIKPTKSNIYANWSAALSAAEEDAIRRKKSLSDALKRKPISSSTLLRTTAGMENSRWVPPKVSDTKKPVEFKQELLSRLLKPTAAVNQGKYVKPEIRNSKIPFISEEGTNSADNSSIQSHKVSTVSERLLKPTANNEHSKFVKVEEPKCEDYFKKHEHGPVKEVSSHLLKPTANNIKRDSRNDFNDDKPESKRVTSPNSIQSSDSKNYSKSESTSKKNQTVPNNNFSSAFVPNEYGPNDLINDLMDEVIETATSENPMEY